MSQAFLRQFLRKIRKKKGERYREWRKKKEQRRAERFRSSLDRLYWTRFLGYLRPYRNRIGGVLFLSLVGGGIGLVIPHAARIILNGIVPKRDFQLLNVVILAALGAYLLHILLRYVEQRVMVTVSLNLITDIRKDLFRHQLNLPQTYFQKYGAGKLISRLTYSIFMVKMLVEKCLYTFFREIVLIAMIILAAFLIDLKLTLIFLALTPLLILYIRRLNRYMVSIAERLQTKNDEILRILDRAFHSVKLFQIFGEGFQEAERFGRVLSEDKFYRIKRTLVYVVNSIAVTFLTSSVLLLALWYGSRQIILGRLSYGDVTGYLICLGIIFRPMAELVKASAYFQAGKIGVRTVFSIFDNDSPVLEPTRSIKLASREGAIEFRNVWFRYGDGNGGLRNVSFTVQPGQRVLIIGPSGSGKSTLFNLLLRLQDCERGSVLVDGVNIRRLSLPDLRSYFCVVTQEDPCIEDSLLNNILLGDLLVENEDQEKRLEKAFEISQKTGMSGFITSLNRKFGEKIGNNGGGGRFFSKGELQRFAIMRAVSREEAPIVLLDEPMTALDFSSQREVLKILKEQFNRKTQLVISHAPLPAFSPDWILVLKGGSLAAQGNHHYLLRHSNYYRQLSRRLSLG